jgi:aminoglycoside phosphotransferase (APT) family kinase protein
LPQLGPSIGGGDQAEVFEYGRDVCKLYSAHIPEPQSRDMAHREAAALRIVEDFDDVPAPKMRGVRQIGGRWGVIMSRIEGPTFSGALGDPACIREMAGLQAAIHRHHAATPLPDLKLWIAQGLRSAGHKLGNALPLQRLLELLADIPDSDALCHFDFQPSNVMGRPGAASVIDWTHAARGEPAIDVCQSWLLMGRSDPGLAKSYVEAYARQSGRAPNDILRWRSIVAGARLSGTVPDEVERLRRIVLDGLPR